jgi:hypothetical protein
MFHLGPAAASISSPLLLVLLSAVFFFLPRGGNFIWVSLHLGATGRDGLLEHLRGKGPIENLFHQG